MARHHAWEITVSYFLPHSFHFKNYLKIILHLALPEAESSSIKATEIAWTGWPWRPFLVRNIVISYACQDIINKPSSSP